MCEILGLTAKKRIKINDYLDIFFSHSAEHRNGWGIALMDDNPHFMKKEAIKASDSTELKKILANHIETSRCIAHIRNATIGEVNNKNTHPFSKCDDSGRRWTLAHNGTIFDSDVLAPFQYKQEGTTDSERIFLYIVDEINKYYKKYGNNITENQRIHIVDEAIKNIVPGNKLNLMIFDGELFYVHKNEKGTMFKKGDTDSIIFSTKPLDDYDWEEVPDNRLLVYKDSELIYVGERHNSTYVHDEEKMKLLYLEYSGL